VTPAQFDSWLADPDRQPLVMGVLNVTPDSFSDGGQFFDPAKAVARGQEMAAVGAAVIDVGGESTRPGSEPVTPEEQIRRVVAVIRTLRDRVSAVLSIDTSSAAVAEAALDAGAHVVNDVFAGRGDAEMLPLAARRGAPIILMHMQGRPANMQVNPTYDDVVAQVLAFLKQRVDVAVSLGVDVGKVLVDPGIGFGKTVEHNLELLRRLRELRSLGRPVVVGASRKAFIGKITGEDMSSGRMFGTAATVAWSVTNRADLLRVHEVGPMSQVVRMIGAIQKAGRPPDFPCD